MEKLPLLTVIVPVYRVEKYLDRCLESVTGQTYKNLEILLVDDGSPDDSGKICDRWAGQDSRIRVIHKANAGAGAARNTALDEAKGSLIGFVDSDDYLHPNFYNYLHSLMTEDVDISECVIGETDGNDLPMTDGTGASVLVCAAEEALRLHIRDEMFCQTSGTSAFLRETSLTMSFSPTGSSETPGSLPIPMPVCTPTGRLLEVPCTSPIRSGGFRGWMPRQNVWPIYRTVSPAWWTKQSGIYCSPACSPCRAA